MDAGPLISPERQQDLMDAIAYVMKKLQEEALYGQLREMMANEELDFEAVDFEGTDPEFLCREGSILMELACSELLSMYGPPS